MSVSIRWMTTEDMDAVIRIERESYEDPWLMKNFIECMRDPTCIPQVALVEGEVAGYVLFMIKTDSYEIVNITASDDYSDHEIGGRLLDHIEKKVAKQSSKFRDRVEMVCHDSDLYTHLFLKRHGYKATKIMRSFYPSGSDAYIFKKKIRRMA